eukprot:2235-Heterococcus_DN1.PRE.1
MCVRVYKCTCKGCVSLYDTTLANLSACKSNTVLVYRGCSSICCADQLHTHSQSLQQPNATAGALLRSSDGDSKSCLLNKRRKTRIKAWCQINKHEVGQQQHQHSANGLHKHANGKLDAMSECSACGSATYTAHAAHAASD